MAVIEKTPEPKTTVRMKYTGHFQGTEKIVALPIPLIANSQKLEQTLIFSRASKRIGPAYCDVPLEWAGALMAVGGHWQLVEPLTPALAASISAAKEVCEAKMTKFVLENELVET